MTLASQFALTDRYEQQEGVVLMSGIQALVRALLTRSELDRAHGVNSGGFVSGYRGSPLGGLDKELWAQEPRLTRRGVVFQPGVNEDLAATAVWGSQQVGLHAGATVDGVYGMWYGKAPGLDRSCDAIRHANAWGTARNGGVLLVVGDDPGAKSSSLASQSEFALQDMMVPILCPSDVQDVLDFAVLGWEMSRHSGLWVGLKAIADHMDSAATVEVDRYRCQRAPLAGDEDVHIRVEDTPAAQEARLLSQKLPAAVAFARHAGVNRHVTQGLRPSTPARLGIIAAGKAYCDVREACAQLGFQTPADLADGSLELLKLGLTWPLDEQAVRDFAAHVDCVLVVEEKRSFVEPQVKECLYGYGERTIPVIGKRDTAGMPLIAETGTLEVGDLTRALARLLDLPAPQALQRMERTRQLTAQLDAAARDERTPLFCAGCPHNTSTRVPEGSRATAGIGCHYMAQWMDRATDGCTQMGGEGVTWVGEAPFTREPHLFANLGDGTYFHSGILAIRQAVAAGVSMTYKILFNDAVAMTGGQPTDGSLQVADVVAQTRAEGVQRVVIVSDEPELLSDVQAEVYHRRELDRVQRELSSTRGVTVLIYQQTCATELRRRRKRGLVADTRPRLVINEAICDGCGDCSVQSNCVAVEPVVTPHGIKRQINQTACNKDLSCATGFCPAFVEVSGELRKPEKLLADLGGLRARAAPPKVRRASANVLITGVGGTGIVTVSALLAVAARIDGKSVRTLDMTGLAQKGGAVFAHVRIGEEPEVPLHTARIPAGQAQLLLACDLVSAASNESLALLSEVTTAIVNSHVTPTADFVLGQTHDPQRASRLARIREIAGDLATFAADDCAQQMLGDTQQANVMLLGYAYQSGEIPLSLSAMEQAICVNGTAVDRNLAAFHLGRAAACDAAYEPAEETAAGSMSLKALRAYHAEWLTDYDGSELARRFQSLVDRTLAVETAVRPGSEVLSRAVAQSYARVLAVKDEFEVARLHLAPAFNAQLRATFVDGAEVRYLLAPPVLGDRKRRFPACTRWLFKVLRGMRGVRNTWLDPFAHTAERKQANALIVHFEGLMREVLDGLTLQNLNLAVELARLPQQVRGFGHVKARQLQQAREREARLVQAFHAPADPVVVFDPHRTQAA